MGLSRFFAPSSVLRLTNKGTLCSRELNFEINLSDIVDTINVPTSEGLDGYIGIQASFGILSICLCKLSSITSEPSSPSALG